jgi:hypothetical protein
MKSTYLGLIAVFCLLSGLAAFGQVPAKPDKKIQVQLLWGTDSTNSPNPAHKPVDVDVQKRLKQLRWSHYFVVTNVTLSVPRGKSAKTPVSSKCAVEVKDLGQHNVEVSYFGKDHKVVKQTQALPKGETIFYAGNAPGTNAWVVMLKRLE